MQQMELIEKILSEENLNEAIKKVKSNKGAPGVDKMSVAQIDDYFKVHKKEIISSIMNMTYKPQPVRRVYIPKANGKKRPLGIPTVVDRVIQQAIAQELSKIYEPLFSNGNYGFRPNRSAHNAIEKVLELLNEGYEWVVDLDIEKYFDTVNHDKLISILREEVNDKTTLHLIRKFLRAGVMENGLISSNIEGMPQGGPLSPILSNIYLNKFDKELESRGLHFVRYADDCIVLVKSEKAAKLVRKLKQLTDRSWSISLDNRIEKINYVVRGWVNYFRIANMKNKITEIDEHLRVRIRVIIWKQWKKIRKKCESLQKLGVPFEIAFNCANTRKGYYQICKTRYIQFAINNERLRKRGLVFLLDQYEKVHI